MSCHSSVYSLYWCREGVMSYCNTSMGLYSTQYELFGVPQGLQLLLHLLYHHGEWGFSMSGQIPCSQLWYRGSQAFRVLLCQDGGDAQNATGLWAGGESNQVYSEVHINSVAFKNPCAWLIAGITNGIFQPGAIWLHCWQCYQTERCWVEISLACHTAGALNLWLTACQCLPLQKQDCRKQKIYIFRYIYWCNMFICFTFKW